MPHTLCVHLLFPGPIQTDFWRLLEHRVGTPIPTLDPPFPNFSKWFYVVGALPFLCLLSYAAEKSLVLLPISVLALIAYFLLARKFSAQTRPVSATGKLPRHIQTIRDLVESIARQNRKNQIPWSRPDITRELHEIFREAAVPESKTTPNTRLIPDLRFTFLATAMTDRPRMP